MVISSEPLVSVIIPTYNRAFLIVRTIDSVIQQSYKNLEIIIVDDASNDNTKEIIQNIKDNRIRYIRHENNLGGSKARNTGIDAAKGDYIAFLDSDDRWFPNKIKSQISAFKNYSNAEKLVSYTQFKIKTIDKINILPHRSKNEWEKVADYLWINGGEILTSTLMLSRSLAIETRFKPKLKKHQDLDFCLRLEAKGANFILLEQPLTIWYNEPRSDRISKLSSYQSSLDWIQGYQGLISNKAIKGFLLKEVIPQLLNTQGKKWYTAKLIIEIFKEGIMPTYRFMILMTKLLLPRNYYQIIKDIVQK
jgi:glycosyltransferase involved in cell wall biosynthesis